MIKFLRTIFILAITLASTQSFSQCVGCQINADCIIDPPGPTLCPSALPNATQGEYYDADITFYLPNSFFEPSAGLTITVSQLIISSVSGLPLGISWLSNSVDNTYQITADSETHRGCVKICGIPTFAGSFIFSVNVAVSVTSPINTVSNQSFSLPLIVEPGSGGNAGFIFNPAAGCDSVDVSFEGIITDDFRPVTYEWFINNLDVVNGQNITQQFNTPDTHQIALKTTLYNYVVNALTVTATSNVWCGDIEEPSLFGNCLGAPDIYFQLTNDGVTIQSPTIDDQLTANFNNLNYVLTSGSFSLSFWDEDVISQNDFMGTAVVTFNGTGVYNFSTPHASGNVTIGTQVYITQNDTDYVIVHPSPEIPLFSWDGMPNTIFCEGEQIILQADSNYFMQWYRDGEMVINANNSSFIVQNSSELRLEIANEQGCNAFSEIINIEINPNPPAPSVFYNAGTNSLFTNIIPGFDLQWLLNGIEITGATANNYTPTQDGAYTLVASNEFGCNSTSQVYDLSTVSIAKLNGGSLSFYPNPAQNEIFVVLPEQVTNELRIEIYDLSGKRVLVPTINRTNATLFQIGLDGLQAGVYMLKINTSQDVFTGRIVKQ